MLLSFMLSTLHIRMSIEETLQMVQFKSACLDIVEMSCIMVQQIDDNS